MKVYWWQGGLHIEPEDEIDMAALSAIWNSKKAATTEDTNPEPCSTSINWRT